MPINPLPISVAVVTLNEEANLPRLLESIRGLVSELVVVDSGSTDCLLRGRKRDLSARRRYPQTTSNRFSTFEIVGYAPERTPRCHCFGD